MRLWKKTKLAAAIAVAAASVAMVPTAVNANGVILRTAGDAIVRECAKNTTCRRKVAEPIKQGGRKVAEKIEWAKKKGLELVEDAAWLAVTAAGEVCGPVEEMNRRQQKRQRIEVLHGLKLDGFERP